jgi:hypothetical protein
MGYEPLSVIDEYIKKLEDMNIEAAVAMQQEAYDRYQLRFR